MRRTLSSPWRSPQPRHRTRYKKGRLGRAGGAQRRSPLLSLQDQNDFSEETSPGGLRQELAWRKSSRSEGWHAQRPHHQKQWPQGGWVFSQLQRENVETGEAGEARSWGTLGLMSRTWALPESRVLGMAVLWSGGG